MGRVINPKAEINKTGHKIEFEAQANTEPLTPNDASESLAMLV
jgi:hypothetical protein